MDSTDRLREPAAAPEIVKAAVEAVEEVRPGSVLAAAVALLDERDALAAALQLALDGLPDPMHPSIPLKFVDRLVSVQIILSAALGDDDPGDLEAARKTVAAVSTPEEERF